MDSDEAEIAKDIHDLVNCVAQIKIGVSLIGRKLPNGMTEDEIRSSINNAVANAESILRLMTSRSRK